MPKIHKDHKFFDFSDYGRMPAIFMATVIKNTNITPIHVTIGFGIIGVLSAYAIYLETFAIAAVGLILKSIVDAMDGELARIKMTPSYSGRYLDSIFDSLLNLLFIFVIAIVTNQAFSIAVLSYVCIQFQGTLYNYYYVILRHNSVGGDTTSQIFEMEPPKAFPIESQKSVNILFKTFKILYLPFDSLMYALDSKASKSKRFTNWFMTMISLYGLGFQLMLMAILLVLGMINLILPFFIYYTALTIPFLFLRKLALK